MPRLRKETEFKMVAGLNPDDFELAEEVPFQGNSLLRMLVKKGTTNTAEVLVNVGDIDRLRRPKYTQLSETSSIGHQVFKLQVEVLEKWIAKDIVNGHRQIISKENWVQGGVGDCGRVWVRVEEEAKRETFEISINTPGTPFKALQYEMPFSTSDETPLTIGAFVMCKVSPFRADMVGEDEFTKGTYQRVYGLHAIEVLRLCRNPNNL
ncbi:hypothetical protein B0H16DRAFT_1459671 [Mycena metata]|uniref:Uncharacterized protein n=1 Tax=Mycena metata TaxID=1033252 RepID=A0AAD7J064_9AGAR|nr:hypothetical protein B0H16DRAFT_1459671 [Mycena metata]